MKRTRNLDQPFVEVAYGRGSRTLSIAAELAIVLALCWIHGAGGWAACAAAIVCGVAAGLLDRWHVQAHWARLSRITIRELTEWGRTEFLSGQNLIRRLLPLAAVVAGGVLLFLQSPRAGWISALTVPFLYVGWLLGRDLALALAPPRGIRGQDTF